MREIYPALRSGKAPKLPQDQRQASYFGGRRPEDGLIDWQKSAWEIYNLVRAVTHPYPGRLHRSARAENFSSGWGNPWRPGLDSGRIARPIIGALPGEGLLVATGNGTFPHPPAQWEGRAGFFGAGAGHLGGSGGGEVGIKM